MNAWEARRAIVEVGRRCYDRGYLAASDGNISLRLDGGVIAATPSGLCKGRLQPADVVLLDPTGRLLEGSRAASSEILLHLDIYRHRPDVAAVVHAHPVVATGFAVARLPLAACVLPEIALALGDVPLAPYATPSTPEVPASIRPKLANHNAFLLANHGTVTLGATLDEAYYRLEKVEQFAQIMLVARQLGRVNQLTPDDVRKLAAVAGDGAKAQLLCERCGSCQEGVTPSGEGNTPPDVELQHAVRRVIQRLRDEGKTGG